MLWIATSVVNPLTMTLILAASLADIVTVVVAIVGVSVIAAAVVTAVV